MDLEFSTTSGAFTASDLADVLYEVAPDATVWLVRGDNIVDVPVPVSRVVVVTPDRVELQ